MNSKGNTKPFKILSEFNSVKWHLALKSIFTGLFAGLLVVLYRFGVEYGTETAVKIYAYLRQNPLMIILWIFAIIAAGLLIARLVKLEPMATGSGIPQVEGLLIYGLKIRWYTVLIARFIGGIISSFFGLSLGREGPSIQIGAAGSQALSKRISKNKLEDNYLITGGAAAGLSAAFNAPLSGIVFTLEEVHRSFSGLILIAATTAALSADVISKMFFGLKPVLSFADTPTLPKEYYLWIIPLGIIAGVIGAILNKGLLAFNTVYRKIPIYLRPCIALLIALPCGLFIPAVLGGGLNLIEIAEKAQSGITVIGIYLVVKILFTCICFGSGTPGGIFMPTLAIGALAGSLLGLVAVQFGLPVQYVPDFAVCAMAGALAGAVKAPVTSILLIVEMTGSISHMLPVAGCSFIALFISDALKTAPIYEALLERIVENNKDIQNDKAGAIIEVSVELGSMAANNKVRDINWPEETLLVGIRRGDKNIVPSGGTIILPGDYLAIMSTEKAYREVNNSVRDLCHAQT